MAWKLAVAAAVAAKAANYLVIPRFTVTFKLIADWVRSTTIIRIIKVMFCKRICTHSVEPQCKRSLLTQFKHKGNRN